jgi:DNA polymerase-1
MQYEIVGNTTRDPTVAILCPVIKTSEIVKHYYDPYLKALDNDVMVCDLFIKRGKKKTPAAELKEYCEELIPNLIDAGITFIIVTQPDYFKVLTKQAKTDATIGDVVPTVVPGLMATYCPNYSRIFYDPDKTREKIDLALGSAVRWLKGDTTVTGSDIVHYEEYPSTDEEILDALARLKAMECDLTCDIEGFSLKHYDAGVGTITFCWNEHEGIAFSVDYFPDCSDDPLLHGIQVANPVIRAALKDFFETYQHKMIYHNICYDVYVLVYQLFMDHILDQEGMLYGLEVMLRNWDCSQLISYLATNSCAGNELGLKTQAQAYAGNYAVNDITDIRLIPEDKLLKYNLIDGLATWYVFNKNHPIMLADHQDCVYQDIFRPAVMDVIQMQLTGMPINMDKVKALDKQLQKESDQNIADMLKTTVIHDFVYALEDEALIKKNLKLKKKTVTRADLGSTLDLQIEFNPGSSNQLQKLLYSDEFLGLPVVDLTKTKQPATGADTLEKLKNHTKNPDIHTFLDILIEYKASAIILSTFLPAFLRAYKGEDGWHYLFGNFRLGGTVSSRLSSNSPNLQNIPSSGSTAVKKRLAKMIKNCFEAPPGWLFVGLDFDSLEDKISAVTTKDPMKVKVYSDGYDGHCLRALAYFGQHMPDLELAPEGARTFMTMIEDKPVYFHAEEEIDYLGTKITGQEFFDLINQ